VQPREKATYSVRDQQLASQETCHSVLISNS
jgi:hypothetical protein